MSVAPGAPLVRAWWGLCFVMATVAWSTCGAVNRNADHPALPMIINPTELSILTVQFNPEKGVYSDWVVNTFGERAIFHNRSYDTSSKKRLEPRELLERELIFKRFFQLPAEALNASCSFEFFGFVPVNTHRPFTWGDKEYRPSIGTALLTVGEAEQWTCYFRGLYENPLQGLAQYPNQHWPIVFFCPASNPRTSCANALAANEQARSERPPRKIPLRVSLPLHDVMWSVDLEVDLGAVERKPPAPDGRAALCTAVPYMSSIPERFEPNGAMLYEFIRYHSELGLRVMVFDRRGSSWPSITYANPYTRRGRRIESYDFDYLNFTVMDRLRPYSKELRAESLDGLSRSIVFTDFDKRFSITFCRFMARAIHGIERVLVLDFDEFLYCPSVPATAAEQGAFAAQHMSRLRAKGVEQYVMRQRVLVSRTPDMQQCLFDQVRRGGRAAEALQSAELSDAQRSAAAQAMHNASIFRCLAAYRHLVRRNFDKSFHLAHVCPYTSFHHSSNLRHFDCAARPYRDFDDGCHAVHFTTKPPNYNRTHPHPMAEVLTTPSELELVTNGLPSPLLPSELQYQAPQQASSPQQRTAKSRKRARAQNKGAEGAARGASGRLNW